MWKFLRRMRIGSAYVSGRCVGAAGSDPEFFQCERRLTMQLTDQERQDLRQMQRILLEEIENGKGVQIAFRSDSLKFDERRATLLLNEFQVIHPVNKTVHVFEKVSIDWTSACAWGRVEFNRLAYLFSKPAYTNLFRVIAFVRASGDVKGGMNCEGMFAVLSQLTFGRNHHKDREYVCRGQEICGEKGKVMLYPIECLVPVDRNTAEVWGDRPFPKAGTS